MKYTLRIEKECGQTESEDVVCITLENGNFWAVQRVAGFYSQELGCRLTKNGVDNPTWDSECDLAVKIADEN